MFSPCRPAKTVEGAAPYGDLSAGRLLASPRFLPSAADRPLGLQGSLGRVGTGRVCVGCVFSSWGCATRALGPKPRHLRDPLPWPETWGGAAASEIASDFRLLAGLAHFCHFPK